MNFILALTSEKLQPIIKFGMNNYEYITKL